VAKAAAAPPPNRGAGASAPPPYMGSGGVSPAPLYGQQASATSASDLASFSHEAGGQTASEDILTVHTRSPTGNQDAPRRHTPAEEPSTELTFTVFAHHPTWLLSVPMLQRLNFGFYYDGDSASVRTPTGRFYPMTKTKSPHLWGMICHSPRRGALVYGPGQAGTVTMKVEVTLYPDSGSTVNVAEMAGMKYSSSSTSCPTPPPGRAEIVSHHCTSEE